MLTKEQSEQYADKGYIIFENLFSDKEIDKIRKITDELDEEAEKALQKAGHKFNSIPNEINFNSNINFKHPELQKFAADPRFADITTFILGPEIRLYWDQTVYKRPEAKRDFPWHQDNGYVPTDPVHYVTCWLALDDSTIENGCIWIQPETHKRGLVPHIKTDIGWVCYDGEEEGIPVELKKGSMVVFHSLLFHRSKPNMSKSQTRKGYVLQYSVEGAKNPDTGKVFKNGPIVAKDGKPVYSEFVSQENC